MTSGPGAAQVAAPGQPAETRPPAHEAAPAPPRPIDCTPQAALYRTEKGVRIWVLRQGRMVLQENPLRPITRDEVVVFEVVVNGRRATAWGLDTNNLRQGGSPKSVEREGREPIRWTEAGIAPPALRVIGEDGRVLVGPLGFAGCEDAPAAKAVADAPEKPVPAAKPGRREKTERNRRQPKTAAPSEAPAPGHLPQGALDGLSLPGSGQRR